MVKTSAVAKATAMITIIESAALTPVLNWLLPPFPLPYIIKMYVHNKQ